MRALPLVLVLLATPALAGRRPDPTPAPQPPSPPIMESSDFDAPPAGSWMSATALRRGEGLDGVSRVPGDVVTVLIVEETSTSLDAKTTSSSSSSQDASISAMFGIENPVPIGGGSGDLGVRTNRSASFDGSGKTGRGSSIDSVVSCTILKVIQPVNDYEIWCTKQVSINKETQWVVLTGRVRARDISRDNTIMSDRIAHAKIEVSGRGVVAEKQRPGVLARVLDKLWPF